MSKPKTYAEAPQEIRDGVEQLIRMYGGDVALLAGALVAATTATILAAKAEEREACAAICDNQSAECLDIAQRSLSQGSREEYVTKTYAFSAAAAAIRKRGEVNTAHKNSEVQ